MKEQEVRDCRYPLIRKAGKRARRSSEQCCNEHRGSTRGSPSSSSESLSSFGLNDALAAIQQQSGLASAMIFRLCVYHGTFRALLLEVEDLKSRHKAREKELSLDVSQLSCELEQTQADRVGFYYGFNMLVEIAKEKFLGVDLSNLKTEDYTV
ncbi:hypothetical protein CJ030_MR1G022545 [Morella rubra]|uniref:Uncharacterized protein n=1 Tax=Morella rubra TaxID=262757 RepID=A0A6A1WQ73_9ROSI|nr:hypothetical protein CJ030_MR1G022545 [Morella rubra]